MEEMTKGYDAQLVQSGTGRLIIIIIIILTFICLLFVKYRKLVKIAEMMS